jgi:hypothetical protein
MSINVEYLRVYYFYKSTVHQSYLVSSGTSFACTHYRKVNLHTSIVLITKNMSFTDTMNRQNRDAFPFLNSVASGIF